MTIASIYDREVITVLEDAVVLDAAMLMRKHHVGELVVVQIKNSKYIPIGIVTDRDLVIKLIATELDSSVITVGDIMESKLTIIKDTANVIEAIQSISVKGIRRIPVIDDDGSLVGILKADDLLQLMAKEFSLFTQLITAEHNNEAQNRR